MSSEDCQAEAARVLGNLTRHKEIRDLIYNTGGENGIRCTNSAKNFKRFIVLIHGHYIIMVFEISGMDQLSKLLSSKDREVVRCACGALVNMMLDAETRTQFMETQGIDKCV